MSLKLFVLVLSSLIFSTAVQTGDGRLLITELYYDTPGDDALEEWVELANVGTAVVDLSNLILSDEEQPGGREGAVQFPEGAEVEPGQVIIVAQTAVGFRSLFGFNPDYEIVESDPDVPTLRRYDDWATGDIGLSNSGDEIILLNTNQQILDAANYGESSHYFAPAINTVFRGQSIERVPANCDSDSAADWQPQSFPTPGQISFDGDCTVSIEIAETASLPTIGEIQGNGDVSPKINEQVTFAGIVTGFYEDINTDGVIFHTMFVQDIPGQADGDAATSDGIAIFLGRERPSVNIGDHVLITGQVTEFFGFTEIDDSGLIITVSAENQPLPDPILIKPPADNEAQAEYFEALEGMRVAFAEEAIVTGPTFSGCGFAVVAASEANPPILRQTIDDPIGQIVPILHISDVDCGDFPFVKTGDHVSGLVGPLIYHFEQFKLVNQELANVVVTAVPNPPQPEPPSLTDHQISIATFNVENHFDSIDDTKDNAEPKPSAAEIRLKEIKIANQIHDVLGCPTLIGIQEVEKKTLLLDLATAVAEQCGFTYTVTHHESADVRGIDVALLSDPNRVRVQHSQLQQTCTELETDTFDETINCAEKEFPLFSRPPLQVDLTIDGEPYTIFINHFKSKRGGEAETTPRRLQQAKHINRLIADLLKGNPEANIVVMGDFNDYELSAPLLEMTENGRLHNTLSTIPWQERYSFNFGGAAQLLDGILVSPALVDEVASVTIQHVNADFPDAAGDNPTTIYKATDHDLPLLILNGIAPSPPPTATPTVSATTAVTPSPETTAVPPEPTAAPQSANNWLWLVGLGILGVGGGTAVYLFRRSH